MCITWIITKRKKEERKEDRREREEREGHREEGEKGGKKNSRDIIQIKMKESLTGHMCFLLKMKTEVQNIF